MLRFLADQAINSAAALNRALRDLRARVLLRVLVRDLSGRADLEEVVGTMSALAEVTISSAHAFWTRQLEEEIGTPQAAGTRQSLLIIGLGKLGGGELNVSSDVDLSFIYPEDGEVVGARPRSNQEFFTRLGQRIIASLNDLTGDGQVFRVDMRLRPWGDAGPLATSFTALETYFVVHGREWERYAWIKARVVAGAEPGSVQAQFAQALEQIVRPFVFRKYLDYGAIESVRALHAQIRQEVTRRDLADHLKLGPGGIREIEFIAQAFQLIRGGRDLSLQAPGTRHVLALAEARGLLDATAARELLDAYDYLRRLEHRLQYLDDAQTHTLPKSEPDRELIAQSMGAPDYAAFIDELNRHRQRVSLRFNAAFAADRARADKGADSADNKRNDRDDRNRHAATKPESTRSAFEAVWAATIEPQDAENLLSQAGFRDPGATLAHLQALRTGARYARLPATSQTRFDALVPQLIAAAADTPAPAPAPDITFGRCLHVLEAVAGRATYLALLCEHPAALPKLADLAAASSWAASYLAQHPVLLDELLDPSLLSVELNQREFADELRARMAERTGDVERQMDSMREAHHAQVFKLLAQDLAGRVSIEQLADHLSALADAVLTVTLEGCWQRVLDRHRPDPQFAVIAYGKLGGKELGYASDLDLIFIYEDSAEDAPQNYARLAQRMITWLSSRTGAGLLFDTDVRLRPNGEAGLLVCSMEGFRRYQRESAWVWEHQALTRARYAAGDAAIGAVFEAERRDILCMAREAVPLASEIVGMRRKMRDAHPNRSGLFDVKHGHGGMIDIEFIVQYLVLLHAHTHHRLTENLGNIALLKMAAELGLIESAASDAVREAYREFRRIQHRLRLNEAQYARVDWSEVSTHAEATRALWQHVFGSS